MAKRPPLEADAQRLTERLQRADDRTGLRSGDDVLAETALHGVGRTYGGPETAEQAKAAAFVRRRAPQHADLILDALGLTEGADGCS